jgi:crotonobetainyl-CoA:carnitine CoA-transferase CaiB-like acyl-CoA transferase
MRVKANHPFEPELSLIRNAITFSGTPVKEYRAPPLLGADTNEVLASIGFDEAKVAGLKERKIV